MVILILVAIFIFASYLTAFMRLQFDFQFQQTPQKAALGALFVPVLLPILIERRRENPCFSGGGMSMIQFLKTQKRQRRSTTLSFVEIS